jgi:hypothetical protein
VSQPCGWHRVIKAAYPDWRSSSHTHGVCAGITTYHALGKASNLASIGMGSLGLCLGVGNELFISSSLLPSPMTEFAISQNHVIGRCRIDICWGIIANFAQGLVGFEV